MTGAHCICLCTVFNEILSSENTWILRTALKLRIFLTNNFLLIWKNIFAFYNTASPEH
jgi:hypothetical protein